MLIPLALAASVLCAVSCSDRAESRLAGEQLDRVASMMEEHPDSALAVLESIDRQQLSSRSLRARYSLLYSQALEKNYVSLESDSVISPAVKYYRYHGTPDEKLLTLYYLGCICWNAGRLNDALECYVQAERYIGRVTDYRAVGRLYAAMKGIYSEIYEFGDSYRCSLKAAEYYAMAGDTLRWGNALVSASDAAENMHMYSSKDSLLDIVRTELWSGLETFQKGHYWLARAIRLRDSCIGGALRCIHAYLRTVTDPRDVAWGIVSYTYFLAGDLDSARTALDKYPVAFPEYGESLQYWLLLYRISKAEGDYRTALSAMERYSDLSDEKERRINEQDVRYVREKYENELQKEKHRKTVVLISAAVFVFLICVCWIIREYDIRIKDKEQEIQRYSRLYAALLEEKKKMMEIQSQSMDDKSRQSVSRTLSLLTELSFLKDPDKPVSEEYRRHINDFLADKNALVSIMFASYSSTNPAFVLHLRSKGLTDKEIGYCCLYASGLSGKDIAFLLNKGGHAHYNMAARIRVKLGLSGKDLRLSGYIRELLSAEK